MRFSAYALTTVPDTATTRHLFGLDDLDDKSVAKVMFHRRKQQTGASEVLRWDQRAIAGLTLIRHPLDQMQVETMTLDTHSEEDMLHAFYKAALASDRLVSWDGGQMLVPLVHFRSLRYRLSYPAYWEAWNAGRTLHLDVRSWLSPTVDDRPTIDETARKLGLPGMLGLSDQQVADNWLRGNAATIPAYSEVIALNTYLLALRLFTMTGEISHDNAARVQRRLRDSLERRAEEHLKSFLEYWDKD